ncbi:MAG: DUF2971 domain-containing protein [Gemmatimonadetes bacterium]|nr:DUF2971 domain-containing protein [Gemmatimonadota bacterium]
MPMNNALRAEWKKAGYHTKMGSAAVVLPPHKKFIRVYHLSSAEFAISNIKLGRLKVARFSDLNDPFELMALNLRERRMRKVVRDFKNTYDSHTGLLCFSADWRNPVLWAHYADKNRGICLGFNLMRDRAQQVQYKDERILANLGEEGDPLTLSTELQELLLRTKYRHWEYEDERRVFVPLEGAITEGSMHFCPFDQNLQLAEVILGPQCSLSLDDVRQLTLAKHPHAVTFAARPAIKFFTIVPKEKTVP